MVPLLECPQPSVVAGADDERPGPICTSHGQIADGDVSICTTRVETIPAFGIKSSPATAPCASAAVAPQVMCHGRSTRR
jgi:hypothetical protein